MKIAIIGTRGIPARYGGFETCAERISEYLAERGHRVLVACRRHLYPDRPEIHSDIKLCYPFYIRGKSIETFSHTFFSIIRSIVWNPDIILIFNSANSPMALAARIYGKKVIINVDGFEWKRRKWSPAGRTYFKFASILSTVAATKIIADSRAVADYYRSRFRADPVYIPYGADIFFSKSGSIVEKVGLKPKTYFFSGSRLEPENNQDLMIEEFSSAKTGHIFAVAGDIRKKTKYVKSLLNLADHNTRFIGSIYEKQTYLELQANSIAYIHGNEVGGTNPALLSAMGCGACVLALDVNFNREVLGDAGLYFTKKKGSLAELIRHVAENPEKFAGLGKMAQERVQRFYRWDCVCQKYEDLFYTIKNEK